MGKDTASRFMALFAGFEGAHGTHGVPRKEPGKIKWEIKSTARTVREPVAIELWEAHLAGERPLGIITIREDNTCLWGSIDVDIYDEDLQGVVERVAQAKLPLVPCRSKSGGLHLFLFLRDPQPAADVQTVLRETAASLGLAGSEIFPKQTQVLAERGDLGNWMVMPYFGSTFDGKLQEQVGVKKDGTTMNEGEFLKVSEKARLGPEDFVALATREKPAARGSKKRQKAGNSKLVDDFSDGPPCLQYLAASGVEEHVGRNAALFHMAIYYRRRSPATWKQDVEEANQRYMLPPLSSEEVLGAIRSLEKKDYEYTCKTEPMCSHCDSMTCRTRRWGVGDEGNLPMISGLSKLDTRPPIWFVDCMGSRLQLTTDQLHKYELFQKACMEEMDHVFGAMKQAVWHSLLNEAMKSCVLIAAPDEVSVSGRFREHLEDFLTNRQRGKRREDLFDGRPWEDEDEGRHYFRLGDLQKFLNREDFRDERGSRVGRNRIVTLIKDLGGGDRYFNIRGKGCATFWVPSEVAQPMPVIEPPPVEDMPL